MKNKKLLVRSILLIFFTAALFAAVTDFAEGRYITASWIAFAGTLSLIGIRWRSSEYVFASFFFWAQALVRLCFLEEAPDGFILLANARFALFIMAACFLTAAAWLDSRETMGRYMAAFPIAALAVIIIGSLKENHNFVSDPHYRNLGYSYVLTFYAAACFAYGLVRKNGMMRISGIVLSGAVVLKLYLHDIWTMNRLVKIIAGFSLGAALVVLSILYQKYHDRIFPKKTGSVLQMALAALAALLLIHAGPGAADAAAGPFKASNWRYYKVLTGAGDTATVYGRLILDDEMILNGRAADYRVVFKGRTVPHLTRIAVDDPKLSGWTVPAVIFTSTDRNGTTFVLKLPEPPAGTEYTGLEAGSSSRFEASATVETGLKAGEWKPTGNYPLFSYQGSEGNRIRFSPGRHRFIRIRINARQSLSFPKALYNSVRTRSYYTISIPPASVKKDTDSDRQATVYYFENSGKKKINRLTLTFKESRYNRMMEILAINPPEKSYELVQTAQLARNTGDPETQVIDLYSPSTGQMKLVLIDGDDSPLTLTSLTAYVPREELIFEIPPDAGKKEAASLRLYYGNPYCLPPEYDIESTIDMNLGLATLTAGKQITNEEFAYSVMEPPVSTWVIRIVFLLGIAGLAYPAWKILKHFSDQRTT
ncbi:MAG: DUF2339 domain-containing protein [Spirochaetes bacterium]|nr:DUF2339 domain-containing protein [Spirochaetota bacterium]